MLGSYEASGIVTVSDPSVERCKGVRNILNKLTDDNFGVLLEQIKSCKIDTMEKLNSVYLLVFKKAVDDPIFHKYTKIWCKIAFWSNRIPEHYSCEHWSQSVRTSSQRMFLQIRPMSSSSSHYVKNWRRKTVSIYGSVYRRNLYFRYADNIYHGTMY